MHFPSAVRKRHKGYDPIDNSKIQVTTIEALFWFTAKESLCQWARAQIALPPLASTRWSMKSWVQDPLGVCDTHQKRRSNEIYTHTYIYTSPTSFNAHATT